MSNAPLMPKATAVWLVDNTALTFDQVADFTKMHPLEVRAIADGDAAQGIKGMDPISTGQLTRDEIERGEKDPNYRLKLGESKVVLPPAAKKKGPRYTPVSRRHERPSAILWLVRNHPELKDAQIMRLVGTTKTTIASVRDRTHWNASTLTPMDPVTLGLCSQIELDFEVQRAAKEKPVPAAYGGATLLPASETTKKEPEFEPSEKSEDDLNVDAVFAKLKTIGGKKQDDEESRDFRLRLERFRTRRGNLPRFCFAGAITIRPCRLDCRKSIPGESRATCCRSSSAENGLIRTEMPCAAIESTIFRADVPGHDNGRDVPVKSRPQIIDCRRPRLSIREDCSHITASQGGFPAGGRASARRLPLRPRSPLCLSLSADG